MSDIIDRIAAAIEQCPARYGMPDWHAVAAAVVEELGLTEEHTTVPTVVGRIEHTQPCEIPDHMIASDDWHTCGYKRGKFEFHPSTRYVTDWVRDE